MDEWTPEPEQRVDAEWLAQEQERLEREETWRAREVADQTDTIVNGSVRSSDGRFTNLPDRVFRTDGADTLSSDEFEEVLLRIREQTIRTGGALAAGLALERAATMRRLCDELEYEAVAYARGLGWSWRGVGDAFGMTESGAHRRFARTLQRRERRDRR
jgi:hypothetical protein